MRKKMLQKKRTVNDHADKSMFKVIILISFLMLFTLLMFEIDDKTDYITGAVLGTGQDLLSDATNNNISSTTGLTTSESLSTENLNTQANCGGGTTCACGDTVTASETLAADISGTGTCLTIGNNNTIIDCNGFKITFGTGGGANVYGVYDSVGYDNVTIKNCVISDGSTSGTGKRTINIVGAAPNYALNDTIFNNTLLPNASNAFSISLSSANYTNITGNTIRSTSDAISLSTSPFTVVTNNTITVNATSSAECVILSSGESNYLVITNNFMNTSGGNAIDLGSLGDFSAIDNNSIYGTTNAITISTSTFVNITNNYLKSTTNPVIGSGSGGFGGSDHYIFNNLISNSSDTGTGISMASSSRNLIVNNRIIKTSGAGIGIFVSSSSYNNTFSNNLINTSTGVSLSISGAGPQNNTFVNNNISSSSAAVNEITDSSAATDINYLVYNNSFGEIRWINNGTGSFLENLDVGIANSNGIGLGLNLFIGNGIASLNTSAFTTGIINSSANITLKIINSPNDVYWLPNYTTDNTDVVNKGSSCLGSFCRNISYNSGTFLFNTSRFSSFAVQTSVSCGAINSSTTLTNNITTSGTCFTISVDNIILDGNGYTITGDGTGNGVHMLRSNVTVRNFANISNFATAFSFSKGNNSFVYNNTISVITNTADAFLIDPGFNNSISNNTIISNGTGTAADYSTMIIFISSTNNNFTNNRIYSSGAYTDTIDLFESQNNTISYNNVTTFGDNSSSLVVEDGSSENIISNNILNSTGASSQALYIAFFSLGSALGTNHFINNNLSSSQYYEIWHADTANQEFIYNNSFGQINWTTANLTTNVTVQIGAGIFIANNTIGVTDNPEVLKLNSSASLIFYGLNHPSTPRLLKNGIRCDNNISLCNITYDSVNGILYANVSSFSNFTTQANATPVVNSITLNATDHPTNSTNSNITLYLNVTDANNDPIKNVTDWRLNGTSITLLNMPFENNGSNAGPKDYSSFGNNGTITLAVWNSTGGYDGKGAYEFGVGGTFISVGGTSTFNNFIQTGNFTISAWIKQKFPSPNALYTIVGSTGTTIEKGFLFAMEGRSSQSRNGTLAVQMYNGTLSKPLINAATVNSTLNDTNWHHVAVVGNRSQVTFYKDGVSLSITGGSSSAINSLITNETSATRVTNTGRLNGATPGSYFNGTIDDIQILNRSLSAEQISAIYNNRSDLIVSQETSVGDIWSACATPNDGTSDGSESCSNNVTIVTAAANTLPQAPDLLYPVNNSFITNRTPPFQWNNSFDADANTLTYQILVDDNSAFNNVEINVSSIAEGTTNTTYDSQTTLTTDTTYYWKVRANDSTGYGAFSNVSNFTLQSYLSITLNVNTVAFGNMFPGQSNNTTANNPPPFNVENSGNIIANVTITGTPFFTSVSFPSSYYQFRVEENESNSFNLTQSNTTFINMSSASTRPHVINLNWENIKDSFLTGLAVTVPLSEPSGAKSSTVTFTIEG